MALPGMTGVDHIGFTVPDLEQAHAFLVDVLGCEYLYSLGPFVHDEPGDDWMTEHLDVDPRAVMEQLHFFRCGDQAIFEVFQWSAPDQATRRPRNSDIAGHHVAHVLQVGAKGTSGVELEEIVGGEATRFQKRNRQRIAQR